MNIKSINNNASPLFLKSAEACKYFNVSQNTIKKWADQGIIKYIRS